MIRYQDGKSLPEIMYEMSEASTREAYRKSERRIKYIYIGLLIFVSICSLINVGQQFAYRSKVFVTIDRYTNAVSNGLMVIILMFLGIYLLHLLKTKYNFEYHV